MFLLGPSHKVYLDFIATTTCTEWETPIGNLKVDTKLVDELTQEKGEMFQKIEKSYEENEHSLEMHIPYIKKVFEGNDTLSLVPLMVGQVSREALPNYGKILAKYYIDPSVLFVISSDFCHWGKRFKFIHRFKD